MAKKILFFLLISILLFGLCNKTFFRNNYEVLNRYNKVVNIPINKFSIFLDEEDQTINLFSLNSDKSNKKFIDNYFNKLESCYNDMYYYDSKREISIYEYSYQNHKISITYAPINICAIAHNLDANWYSKFKDAKYEYIKYDDKEISYKKFDKLINKINELEMLNIDYDVESEGKVLKTKFEKNNKIYECEIFTFEDNYIVLKITNDNNTKTGKFETYEGFIDTILK